MVGALKSPASQRGMVLPITAVSLVTLMGFAALALDLGHVYLNKTRLQNVVDAAALSAAKELDISKSSVNASLVALINFWRNLSGAGNKELKDELGLFTPQIEFSSTVNPFVAGAGAGPYVRVSVSGLDAATWFAGVLGVDELSVGASAVAGPTPSMGQVCSVIPVVVCGDPNGVGFFGYQYGNEATLKIDSNGNGGNGEEKFNIGPGNFQFLELEGANGANDIRDGMAGIGERCIDATKPFVVTDTGNKVGPAASGIDTRFEPCAAINGGVDCSLESIKPDMVAAPGISHAQYVARYRAGNLDFPDPAGIPERRIVTVPMAVCTGDANGTTQIAFLGFGCFFLTRPIARQGSTADLYGQFLEGCGTKVGAPGPSPNSGSGMYKIVLYKDTESPDS